ncbi:helix-turn-helix domain-containing protein [Bradyrhizobium arachidis]|uniref:helix-turn-helix domain-containing protein n=1 Tax=Bradyrhizobium arachidis TaxID=858423 RepID=UPI0024C0D731|nr:helix-turn-helix transcriptional regulator [Bradyrhizobium arachidis]
MICWVCPARRDDARPVTRQQVKAARAWLDMSQDQLSAESLVARRTIQDFETGKREPMPRTVKDLRLALERSGIEFLFNGDRAVGIRERDSD